MTEIDVLKTCRKDKLLGKKIWKNALVLKGKTGQGIFEETFVLALLSSTVFPLQNRVSEFSNLFCSRNKSLLSEFLRKWGWFQGHNKLFPNILAKNWNFKKLRHGFADERALITTALISSCHCKTLVPFAWERKVN